MHKGILAGAMAWLLLTGVASADDPKGNLDKKRELEEGRKKGKEELREARKELKEALKAGDAGAAEQAKENLKKAREELHENRDEQRAAQAEELKKKWGADLDKPGVKEELRKHHRRMARLRRIGQLAKQGNKEAIQKRAEAAIVAEKKRHDAKMTALTKAGAK